MAKPKKQKHVGPSLAQLLLHSQQVDRNINVEQNAKLKQEVMAKFDLKENEDHGTDSDRNEEGQQGGKQESSLPLAEQVSSVEQNDGGQGQEVTSENAGEPELVHEQVSGEGGQSALAPWAQSESEPEGEATKPQGNPRKR